MPGSRMGPGKYKMSPNNCAKSKAMLKEWWGYNKPVRGDVTGKTGGNLSMKTIKLAHSNPWIKWDSMISSYWKLDKKQDNYTVLKYILTKYVQTMKEKKVASSRKSPSDSTFIRPSKRISSVVGKIKTAIKRTDSTQHGFITCMNDETLDTFIMRKYRLEVHVPDYPAAWFSKERCHRTRFTNLDSQCEASNTRSCV